MKTVPFYVRSMNTEHKLYIGLYFTACFDEAGVHSVEKKRRHKMIRSGYTVTTEPTKASKNRQLAYELSWGVAS